MHRISAPLLCAAIAFGLLGSAKGLDEGLIATTVNLPSFIHQYGLEDKDLSGSDAANRLSTITSMVHLGSLPGALVAYLSGDRIGPLWAMRQLCMLWIVGVIIVLASGGSYAQLIAGRCIMGIGIGQAGIIAPTYLAEVASARHRGLLVGLFSTSEYVGIVLGYFAGYGASIHQSDHSSRQWVLPQASQIIMAGLLLLTSFGCVDSPRYLCKTRHPEQAAHALSRLRRWSRSDSRVTKEIELIQTHMSTNQRRNTFLEPWKNLFGQSANRSRMAFLLSAQLLSQWSGTNAITTYAPKFFSILGISSTRESLLSTAIFGLVKLAAALVSAAFFLDRIGRKRSLVAGITLQLLALLYVAIYLTVLSGDTDTHRPGSHGAAVGAIVSVYVTGVGYAFGWNSVQYLLNAEFLPDSVRTLGTSILMCVHYANRFALVKAVPSMMLPGALHPNGTFWFFAAIAFLSVLWAVFLLPETARRELEEAGEVIT
ncbi:general substrate transporter [Aspergillus unguis]